jgi:2-oxoglutarate ferredoxin oxidoreductase subunit alpha
MMDFTILVGGAAGQGIETVGLLLEKTIKRSGYEVFTYKNYMSMVRGGHNFLQIRFSDRPLYTFTTKVDMIFALTEETVEIHEKNLKDGGIILADDELCQDMDILHLGLGKASRDIGNSKVFPTVGFGAIVRHFGLDIEIAKGVLQENFKGSVQDVNLKALEKGFEMAVEKASLPRREDKNIIINGNQALALGAIAAGCKYYCGYPMTPSTSIMSYISSKASEMGIVVDQIEDEVAALNMVLGASYAGVRAMTGSSGGGFALMVEAMSLAGILETPVVVVNAQRPGPATGLSTRTEQADLRFVIHAGHGEFPKMVITLRTPEDAFYQAARAFNISEKFQIPVVLMTEEYLTDYMITSAPFDFSKIKIDRNLADQANLPEGRYKRYQYTDNGVSPRLIPGRSSEKIILVDSHEHDEYGNIDESVETRVNMMKKRMKKLEELRKEVQDPWFFGDNEPKNLFVAFGATYGALKEAVERLNEAGESAGGLVFGDVWPFPVEKLNELGSKADRIIMVEQNFTGQLESLVREHTKLDIWGQIRKYDGRAINGDEIIAEYNQLS